MILSIITGIASFVLMILYIFYGDAYIPETKNALLLFMNNVLPAMFPFYVLSSIIVSNESISILTRPFRRVSGLYNLPKEASCAILLGLLCGFPVGAKITCDLLKNNHISKYEAAILASFTNNASPAFIISIIGRSYLNNESHGLIIWLCITLSSLLTGIVMSRLFLKSNKSHINYYPDNIINKTNISESISSGFNTSLYVCAVIVFFSSITALLKKIPFLSEKIYLSIYSVLEMSGGLNALFKIMSKESYQLNYTVIIAILSFSGMCVHMQICGILKSSNIKTKYYFIGKLIQTGFAVIIINIVLYFTNLFI